MVGLISTNGCETLHWRQINPFEKPIQDPGIETMVLRNNGLVEEKPPATVNEKVSATMSLAREHYRKEEYDKAEPLYAIVADNEKNPPPAVQEAIYYRAECLRLQGYYPKAADLYSALLSKFPNSSYREQCVQHMFDIANYWLDDTRQQMREDKEKREGKRWFVAPRFLSTERTKPLLDREGRAIEKLEQVRLHDINGPLADESLFMCGVIKMYNEDYREADHYFSQIHARHPDSKRAAQSLKLAIFCKHMSTGGSDYDGRKAAEARKLVQAAFNSYPDLVRDSGTKDWLENQRRSIDLQQAEKDFKMAEFYRRTGHPGSAYFYYQLVRNRYPETRFARMAEERWAELREDLERSGTPTDQWVNPLDNLFRKGPATEQSGAQPRTPGGEKKPNSLPETITNGTAPGVVPGTK